MSFLQFKTIKEIRHLLDNKKISLSEIITETKKLFSLHNPILNCAIEIFEEDGNLIHNNNFPLSSIPYVHKDVILKKGKLATAGSKILTEMVSPYSATVINKLSEKGAISLGRANCDEFAMGSSGETSFYGPSKNPWDINRVPGGSSSGSAVAVAAGLVPFALGTETGGSVRQPACLCGLVGLKTSYGLHSRYGIIAYASSLDQVGIFAKTVEDVATVLSATAGHDPKDNSTTQTIISKDYTKKITNSVKGKKIAIVKNAFDAEGISLEVKKNLSDAIVVFKSLGIEFEEITLNTMEYSAALYFVISRAEAASNLSRFDGVKYGYRSKDYTDLNSMYENTRSEGFGYTVQRRIILGNYVLAADNADQYYNKAKKIQGLMKEEFFSVLEKFDALFLPVTPEPAFRLGEMVNNPLAIDLQDYFTAAANLVGIPGLAIPSGFINGLPIGFQLLGKLFDEETLLQLGYNYQQKTDWHTKKPLLKV